MSYLRLAKSNDRARVLRAFVFIVALTALFALVMVGISGSVFAANPPPVQTFYVPGPEADILTDLDDVNSNASSPIFTYISLAASGDGTYVYYDHWENNYENDISNPVQSDTLVLGNSDISDGCAATYFNPPIACAAAADDVIDAGDILVFNNAVDTATPLTVDFDGRDKIASSRAIAVTRVGWATDSGTLHAGAWEVFDTNSWGDIYDVPIGLNTANQTNMFDIASLHVMAFEDDTSISLNGVGVVGCDDVDQGETCFVRDVNEGDQITTGDVDHPVQVHMITGDDGSNYESRWFTLIPTPYWSSAYVSPVGSFNLGSSITWAYLFNPQAEAINYSCDDSSGSFASGSIAARASVRVIIGDGDAYRCSADDTFFMISTIDSPNQDHDWGFAAIPESAMFPQILTGFAPGDDPTYSPPENGSPLWVTTACVAGTYVYVDWDNDGTPDAADTNGDGGADSAVESGYLLSQFEQLRLYKPNVGGVPQNQTGAYIYSFTAPGPPTSPSVGCDLAVAWGQDPRTASAGVPGLDVGTGIPPLPLADSSKGIQLLDDVDSDGEIGPGDTVRYTVNVINQSRIPVPNIYVFDSLPIYVTYVPSTTFKNIGSGLEQIPDNPASDDPPFPLDVSGSPPGVLLSSNAELPVNGTWSVQFDVMLNPIVNLPDDYYDSVENCSITTANGHRSTACVDVDVASGDWGDLPASDYETLKSDNGAVHAIPQGGAGVWLGSHPDREVDGNPALDPNHPFGDNARNLADEDGIEFFGNWADTEGEFEATVSGGDACLNSWLDFTDNSGTLNNPDSDFFDDSPQGAYDSANGDGTEPDEWVVENMPVISGTNLVTFTLPPGVVNLDLLVRVRLTPRDAAGNCSGVDTYLGKTPVPNGLAYRGEVEDYMVTLNATAITLERVSIAAKDPGQIALVLSLFMALAATSIVIVYRRRRQTVRS